MQKFKNPQRAESRIRGTSPEMNKMLRRGVQVSKDSYDFVCRVQDLIKDQVRILRNKKIEGNTQVFKKLDPSLDLRNYLDMYPIEDFSQLLIPHNGRIDSIEMKELLYLVEGQIKKWISSLKQVVPMAWTKHRTKKGFNNFLEIAHGKRKSDKELLDQYLGMEKEMNSYIGEISQLSQ